MKGTIEIFYKERNKQNRSYGGFVEDPIVADAVSHLITRCNNYGLPYEVKRDGKILVRRNEQI